MGIYIYISEHDRIYMRNVEDFELNKLLSEALIYDPTLMISEIKYYDKKYLFSKPKEIIKYNIYHECYNSDNIPTYQARLQSSASGSKELVTAYLYGIINGNLHSKNKNLNG